MFDIWVSGRLTGSPDSTSAHVGARGPPGRLYTRLPKLRCEISNCAFLDRFLHLCLQSVGSFLGSQPALRYLGDTFKQDGAEIRRRHYINKKARRPFPCRDKVEKVLEHRLCIVGTIIDSFDSGDEGGPLDPTTVPPLQTPSSPETSRSLPGIRYLQRSSSRRQGIERILALSLREPERA